MVSRPVLYLSVDALDLTALLIVEAPVLIIFRVQVLRGPNSGMTTWSTALDIYRQHGVLKVLPLCHAACMPWVTVLPMDMDVWRTQYIVAEYHALYTECCCSRALEFVHMCLALILIAIASTQSRLVTRSS